MDSIKRTINRCLAPLNLKVVKKRKPHIEGAELLLDLPILIPTGSPVCLDIGANTGQTIEFLCQAFSSPEIYSFEPSTAMFRKLESANWGPRVHLFNCAMGAIREEREFINFEDQFLGSFLPMDDDGENRFREVKEAGRERVSVDTVDGFVTEHGIESVDLLKSDTQGFEREVIDGARESVKRGIVKNVLIEMNFVKMYRGQAGALEIFQTLTEQGFRLVDLYQKVRQKGGIAWATALFTARS